jgi:enterochelin esterase family protein
MHKFVRRALKEGTPLIDKGKATFVWEGETPPVLAGDFSHWQPVKMEPIEAGAFAYTVNLPNDAYIEYSYFVGSTTGERLRDPHNKRRTSNGMGKYNHYFRMKDAKHTDLVRAKKGVQRGTVTEIKLMNPMFFGGTHGKRRLWLYQPPVEQPVPLLFVWDGNDYYRRAKLTTVIDNLIAHGRIRPVAVAMLENGKAARFVEYACSEATLGAFQYEVLPLAQQHLRLCPPSEQSYGVLGASMGGLMALYAGLRLSATFGQVFSQSGAFVLDGYEMPVVSMVKHQPKVDLKIWLDWGQYEDLAACNRQMAALLKEKDYSVNYREYAGGHNYTMWRDDLWRGLEYLFGK